MLSSMTGFGHFEYSEENKRVSVEIKSVNHRYLDLSIKTSRGISYLESTIRNYIKPRLTRGKVDVYIHYHESAEDTYQVRYNSKIAMGYVQAIHQLQQEYEETYNTGLKDDLSVSTIVNLPDVFELVAEEKDETEQFEFVKVAIDKALAKYIESKQIEGDNLKADLSGKLSEMSGYVDEIERRSPDIIEDYKKRLLEKVHDLFEDRQIDENRIAMEVTLFADKICVDEEIVRLKSHIKEMTESLSSDEPVGRKLDFLAQEMNREANTILSKSTDSEIADIGINLKTLIEKVREQIQNIE